MNELAADFVIIGAGPAGVSAAWALVESGRSILMLEAGDMLPAPAPDAVADFSDSTVASPKLRDPRYASAFNAFRQRFDAQLEQFSLWGMHAVGGLTNAWGGGVAEFDTNELGIAEIKSDMQTAYARLAERITVAGDASDKLHGFYGQASHTTAFDSIGLATSRPIARMLGAPHQTIQLGHARAALDKAQNAPYNAASDITELQKNQLFELRTNTHVDKLIRTSDVFQLILANGENLTVPHGRLLLAAGTIATTTMVARACGYTLPIPFQSSPSSGFAALFPRFLLDTALAPMPRLPQASFTAGNGDDLMFGNLFAANAVDPVDLIAQVPFSVETARQLIRFLEPGLVLGNVFFSGTYSDHRLQVDGTGKASITGSYKPGYAAQLASAKKTVARALRQCGGLLLPGSFATTQPGSDIHYAASLPMCIQPQGLECSSVGELAALRGLHIVDGSILPKLPAKAHTWTIMANADRIARHLAVKI